AIQMRGSIVKDLDLGGNGHDLSQNIVFEASTIENLAKHLYELRRGQTPDIQDPKVVMRALIQKYSVTQKHTPGSKPLPDAQIVLLTGATGGLGSQLVSQLCFNPSISKIYCLLRGHEPLTRLHSSLQDRKLDLQTSKITALASDLTLPTLGLDEAIFSEIQSSITHIIHAAWPVNFQLPLPSFEPHIQGLHNLLQLSLSSPYTSPAKLLFCSSVSTALGAPSPSHIPESVIEDLDHASDMGYGRSKLVGEHIVAAAVRTAGAQASILRIGQVVGDGKFGMWNDSEAFPSIVRSALTMGILPELPIKCEWLPVDTLAECVIELAGLAEASVVRRDGGKDICDDGEGEGTNAFDCGAENEENRKTDERADIKSTARVTTPEPAVDFMENKSIRSSMATTNDDRNADTTTNEEPSIREQPMNLVYNLLSPHTISWTHDFLPALHRAGLSFSPVPTKTWLQRLHSFSQTDSSSSSSSNATNKINDSSASAAADPEKNPALKLLQYHERTFGRKDEEKDGRVEFEIGMAERDSAALRGAEDVVGSGLVGKMVGWWMGRWESREGLVEGGDVKDGDVKDEDVKDGDVKDGDMRRDKETVKREEETVKREEENEEMEEENEERKEENNASKKSNVERKDENPKTNPDEQPQSPSYPSDNECKNDEAFSKEQLLQPSLQPVAESEQQVEKEPSERPDIDNEKGEQGNDIWKDPVVDQHGEEEKEARAVDLNISIF
ncbi:MAG: hypothetical protein L6R42_008538, partial [Xanthoria sp. 1 TBL-2021]